MLGAGRNHPEVDYVIVQSHLAIALPVRWANSSGYLINKSTDSELWNVLNKHQVDLYFAGEIHHVTSSMDDQSGLVQIVHGNVRGGVLIGDVEDNRLTLRLYIANKTDEDRLSYDHAPDGELILAGAGAGKTVRGSGLLSPIDRDGLLIHYAFDQTDLSKPYENTGSFGPRHYVGHSIHTEKASGVLDAAAKFGGQGYVVNRIDRTPWFDDAPRTFAAWVKTSDSGYGMICCTAEHFHFGVNNGLVQCTQSGTTIRVADSQKRINDGQWHHVAIAYPGRGAALENSRVYIDGNLAAKDPATGDTAVDSNKWGHLVVGAHGGRLRGAGRFSRHFNGTIDDFGGWYSALSAGMIKALYNAVQDSELQYNAAVMDSLFTLYRRKTSGNVAGRSWAYATGLAEQPVGAIIKDGTDVSFVLDRNGGGVTTRNNETWNR